MENNVTCRRPIIFHVDEIIKTVKERIGATAKVKLRHDTTFVYVF